MQSLESLSSLCFIFSGFSALLIQHSESRIYLLENFLRCIVKICVKRIVKQNRFPLESRIAMHRYKINDCRLKRGWYRLVYMEQTETNNFQISSLLHLMLLVVF